jgi:hypothetical protein
MASRKNAMLTTEDRRWLTGEKRYEGEHAKQQRYQRRRDIHERVYNSLLDFSILFAHLEERERAKLFGSDTEERRERFADPELADGVRDGLAFLLYNAGIAERMGRERSDEDLADRLLEEAIYRAGRRDDVLIERVALEIEATRMPGERLLDRLEAGEALSPAELGFLLELESVDAAAVQERVREQVFEEDSPNGDG